MGKNRSVSKNAVLNVIKQCCNILFPMIMYPYVSRVLGAELLGRYSFSNSLITYMTLVAGLGIPTYAVREGAKIREDKSEIEKYASEIFSINLISALCSYAFLLVLILTVARFKREYVLIGVLATNIITFTLSRDWINSAFEDFKYITIRYIVFQSIALILTLVFVKSESDLLTYTIITVIGNSGGYLANIFYTRKYVKFKITRNLNLKKHIKPIIYLFCISIAATIYVNSDITIIGFFCPDSDVGIYTIVSKIYTILKSVLNAVIMVAIPRLAFYLGNKQKREYHELLTKLRNSMIVLIIPCIVGLFCMSEETVQIVGGNEFLKGVPTLRILCFSILFSVMGCFYAHAILIANGEEKLFFYATAISAVINLALNLIMIPLFNINGAACTTLIAEIMVMFLCKQYSAKYYKDKVLDVWQVAVGCVVIIIICLASKKIISNYLIRTIVAIIISAMFYFGSLLLLHNGFANTYFKKLISKAKVKK